MKQMTETIQALADVTLLYVHREDSIRVAMQRIGQAAPRGLPGGIALVVDEAERLEGVVTDGDIRRALLGGIKLDERVDEICTFDPIVFSDKLSFRQVLEEIPRRLKEKGRYRGGVLEKVILVDEAQRVQKVMDFLELWRNQRALHRHIAVVGLGYVGLTLAVTLADVGFQVTGVEINEQTRVMLQNGEPHFHEVGLEPLLRYHVKRELEIADTLPGGAEIYVLAVATPVRNRIPDLHQLRTAAYQVGSVLSYGDLVVLRSTCPVGTSRQEVLPILEEVSGLRCGRDFYLSFAPERTLEGKALTELKHLPQIIGGYDQNSVDMTASLFRELSPLIITTSSLEAAEMAKLVNNSFRDVRFAFANELAMICEHFNLDTVEIIQAANEGYPRDRVPVPGPGVGGACLIKDPYIYAQAAGAAGMSACLSLHGRQVNEAMPRAVIQKVMDVLKRLGKRPETSTFFIIGFAFKGEPETSDMRHSTTLDLLELLRGHAGTVRGYDPIVPSADVTALGVEACSLEEGFVEADCVLVMNNHRSYANMDIYKNLSAMNRPAIYCDTWHIFSPEEVKQIGGVTYVGLGFTA